MKTFRQKSLHKDQTKSSGKPAFLNLAVLSILGTLGNISTGLAQSDSDLDTDRLQASCSTSGCHSAILAAADGWAEPTRTLTDCLEQAELGASLHEEGEEDPELVKSRLRLECLVQPGSPLQEKKWNIVQLGFYRAGLEKDFKEDFLKVFDEDTFNKFNDRAQMPPKNASNPKIQDDQYEDLKTQVEKFSIAFPVSEITCQENQPDWLKAHIEKSKDYNWNNQWYKRYRNLDAMDGNLYGCPELPSDRPWDPLKDPLECFKNPFKWQNIGYYTDSGDSFFKNWKARIFLDNKQGPSGTSGSPEDFHHNLKVLYSGKSYQEVPAYNYWMRSSPDGRYVANGAGIVVDLQEDITFDLPSDYDPGFSADNLWFSYMSPNNICKISMFEDLRLELDAKGTTEGLDNTKLCADSSLKVTLDSHEKRCKQNKLVYILNYSSSHCRGDSEGISLYQHHATTLNPEKPQIVVRGTFANDPGGMSGDPDAMAFMSTSTLEIFQLDRTSFEYQSLDEFTLENRGDFGISPNATLLTSRSVKEVNDFQGIHDGYEIRTLFNAEGKLDPLGSEPAKFCLFGGKASVSFDDRFLTTHHYVTQDLARKHLEELYLENPDGQIGLGIPTLDKEGSSNIYVVDMYTGTKLRVTLMPKGVYAMYPHVRADNWLYFKVTDSVNDQVYFVASDILIRLANRTQL